MTENVDPLSFLEPDLEILGVVDAGVPNHERIVIRPTRPISLAGFGITLGVFVSDDLGAAPLYDNVFWFPDIVIDPPTWLFIYTGPGRVLQTTVESGEPALCLHWQRQYVVFTDPSIVPVLFEIGFARLAKHLGP